MILAIQPGAMGDFILSVPALRALRLGPGRNGMEIWAERGNLPLVEHPAYTDCVRPLAETGLDSYPVPAATLQRIQAFEQVISWRGAGFDELRERVLAVQPGACFLPQFPPAGAPLHLAEFRAQQLAPLLAGQEEALAALSAAPRIFFSSEDEQMAARLLGGQQTETAARGAAGAAAPPPQPIQDPTGRTEPPRSRAAQPLVVLHPGASSRRKQWPAAGFAAVAIEAAREWGARVLISEGPLDSEAAAEVLSLAAGSRAETLRVPNLRHLAAVLHRATLFVGNDSGIAHLAAAAGAPALIIFQATDPRLWAPRGRGVRVLVSPSVDEARRAVRFALATS